MLSEQFIRLKYGKILRKLKTDNYIRTYVLNDCS